MHLFKTACESTIGVKARPPRNVLRGALVGAIAIFLFSLVLLRGWDRGTQPQPAIRIDDSFVTVTAEAVRKGQEAALKSAIGAKAQLSANLRFLEDFGRKLSREDRERLVRAVCAGGEKKQWVAPLQEVADLLMEALADDGRPDLILMLLRDTQCGPWTYPLVSELHDLRLAGKVPSGVQLLFDAYDCASTERNRLIEERLSGELAFYLRGKSLSGLQIVAWARAWYANNKDRLLVNHEASVSEGDPWSSPCLIELGSALERLLTAGRTKIGAGKLNYDQYDFLGENPSCSVPFGSSPGPGLGDFVVEMGRPGAIVRVLSADPLEKCGNRWSFTTIRCEVESDEGRSFVPCVLQVLVEHHSSGVVLVQ